MTDKCSDPKPFQLPGGGDGSDVFPMKEGEPFQMTDQERVLFDGYAQEQVAIAGTPVDYWTINVPDSKRDALYGEPVVRKFVGPFRFKANFSAPSHNPQASENGITASWDAAAWIARKTFEDAGAPMPTEGDVMHVWDLPIYVALSTQEPKPLPGAGYYFDVLDVDADGYMLDTPTFTGYKFTLKRRAEFTPERRLERP